MTTLLVLALVVGLVIYGLQRNHSRQERRPGLAGSVNFVDRDFERINADLAAAASLARPHGHRRQSGRRHFTVRHV